MEFNKIIGLASAALSLWFYKKTKDEVNAAREEIEEERKNHADYVNELLSENERLEDKVDPNKNANQPPVTITATMRVGGQMLEAKEIVLNITNTSNIALTLKDFQAHIWVCGYMADLCVPSNVNSIRIPAKTTMEFRMYAEYGKMFSNYVDVKRALNKMYDGKNSTFMRAGMFIPVDKAPVVMNLQFLWVGSTFEDECFVYNIPGSYRWKYAGWTEGADAGYNAVNPKSRYLDDTYWNNTDEINDVVDE